MLFARAGTLLAQPFDAGSLKLTGEPFVVVDQVSSAGGEPTLVMGTDFPASSDKWQISTNGGTTPHWRADGKELFYLSDGKLMAAEVKPGHSFEAGVPQALFDLAPVRARSDLDGGGFAVTADGQRFIFVGRAQGSSNSQYTVVINWTAEAKK